MNDFELSLKRFKEEYQFTELAEDIIDSLYLKYGGCALYFYMDDPDLNYCNYHMKEIKIRMENDFIICVDYTEDTLQDKIKIYDLFPNSEYLHGNYLYPEYEILEKLIKKHWIVQYKIFIILPFEQYKIAEKLLLFKGFNWENCPKPIQDHFIKLKGE